MTHAIAPAPPSLASQAGDVQLESVRALRGRNVAHDAPVILAELSAGRLAALAPSAIAGLLERLDAALPGTASSETFRSWGALLAGITRELERLAGAHPGFARLLEDDPAHDRWTIALGYDEEELTREAVRDAARVIRDCLRGDDPEIEATVSGLVRYHHRARPDPTTLAMIAAARQRGIPVRRDLDDGVVQLGLGVTRHLLHAATTRSAGAGGLEILEGDATHALDGNDHRIVVVSGRVSPDNPVPREIGAILDRLYPAGAPVTIPVIAVTGTNGKTTTTRLIAHLFRHAGRTVGYTTTDGVYFQEQLLMQGDLTGPFAANVVLSHPKVEVAVLETARGGILRSGIGFDECDVGVVLNVTSDHLGLRGIDTVEQLADVKAVIASAVRAGGHTVLNADDPLVLAMRERTAGQVVLFTMTSAGESPTVEEHLANGGIVARVEGDESGETIVIRDGARRVAIAAVGEVPLTFGGQARFQVQNVLAAVAAAYVQELSAEQIRAGLMSFIPSSAMTPGRLNVVETTHGRIILDYAHNIAAIRSVLEFVAAIPAGKHLALISAPGDRRDEDLRAIGRLAAGMDVAIFKEHDHYRRGREPGAIAQLMTEALLETGFPADRVATFVEEPDAIAYALGLMRAGDVALVVTDDLPAVMEQLRPYLISTGESDVRT